MAVNLKSGENYGFQILDMFGVNPSLIQQAKYVGVIVEQQSLGSFHVITKDGEITGVIPIKGQALSLAKAGTLGPASKQAIQYQFEQALTKAIQSYKAEDQPTNLGALLKKKLKQSEAESLSINDDTPGIVVGMDLSKDDSILEENLVKATTFKQPKKAAANIFKTPVPLVGATQCGQPVKGTSPSSVYYMVAKLIGLNLAIRTKGGKLSVRAEGVKLGSYASELQSLGFATHDKYASVHFDVGNAELATKTVGAIVAALGFNHVLEVLDPTTVWGK